MNWKCVCSLSDFFHAISFAASSNFTSRIHRLDVQCNDSIRCRCKSPLNHAWHSVFNFAIKLESADKAPLTASDVPVRMNQIEHDFNIAISHSGLSSSQKFYDICSHTGTDWLSLVTILIHLMLRFRENCFHVQLLEVERPNCSDNFVIYSDLCRNKSQSNMPGITSD